MSNGVFGSASTMRKSVSVMSSLPRSLCAKLSPSAMIGLVLGYHDVDVNSAPQLTVPVAVDQFGDYVYEGGGYGNIEFPAQPQDHNAVDQFLGLTSNKQDTYSGGTLPSPSTVTVSVLNGSGAPNQATTTAQSVAISSNQLKPKISGKSIPAVLCT